MRTLRFLLPFLGALPIGCGEGPTECPSIAEWSVTAHVIDAQGKPVTGASVTYAVDGGPETPADCTSANLDACEWWVAGTVAGEFSIRAQNADGTRTAHASVHVGSGECGVLGQRIALTL